MICCWLTWAKGPGTYNCANIRISNIPLIQFWSHDKLFIQIELIISKADVHLWPKAPALRGKLWSPAVGRGSLTCRQYSTSILAFMHMISIINNIFYFFETPWAWDQCELSWAVLLLPVPVSNTKACLSAYLSRNRQLPLLPSFLATPPFNFEIITRKFINESRSHS